MKNAVKRAYQLADGQAIEVKEANGKRTIDLSRPMLDPMATVVVVEIEGPQVER